MAYHKCVLWCIRENSKRIPAVYCGIQNIYERLTCMYSWFGNGKENGILDNILYMDILTAKGIIYLHMKWEPLFSMIF